MTTSFDIATLNGGISVELLASLNTKNKNKKDNGSNDGPLGTFIIITNKFSENDIQLMWVDMEFTNDFVMDAFNYETRHKDSITYRRNFVEFKHQQRFRICESLFDAGKHKDFVDAYRNGGKENLKIEVLKYWDFDNYEDLDIEDKEMIDKEISEVIHCSDINRLNPENPQWFLEEIPNDYIYTIFPLPEENYRKLVKGLNGVKYDRYDWNQCGHGNKRCHFLFFPSGTIDLRAIVEYWPDDLV